MKTLSIREGESNVLGETLAILVDDIEKFATFDKFIEALHSGGQRCLRSKRLRQLLSGTPFGHPAHPAAVDLPIGFWTSAMALDLVGRGQRKAARRLIGLGLLSAIPAMMTGFSEWLDTDEAEARVGLVHAFVNTTAATAYALSWWTRRRGGRAGLRWSLVGAATAVVGGWLGGHLAYGLGVGVDTNAFETGPHDWTPVDGTLATGGRPACVVAGGVRIAAVEVGGTVRAMADRCSHRGGPLSEGHVSGDCLVCPWHGSAFDLRTGVPAEGPASIPQPIYEARLGQNGFEVQRHESRGLRSRAVRPSRR